MLPPPLFPAAIHEAGHAVVAVALGIPFAVVEVSVRRRRGVSSKGGVLVTENPPCSPRILADANCLRDYLAFLAAGAVAQRQAGCGDALLSDVLAELFTHGHAEVRGLYNDLVMAHPVALALARWATGAVSPGAALDELQLVEARAELLLRERRAAVLAVADALEERGALIAADVQRLVEGEAERLETVRAGTRQLIGPLQRQLVTLVEDDREALAAVVRQAVAAAFADAMRPRTTRKRIRYNKRGLPAQIVTEPLE
jgi:hypothetical protein